MNKLSYSLIIILLSHQIFADTSESTPAVVNTNDTYINRNAYLQNP